MHGDFQQQSSAASAVSLATSIVLEGVLRQRGTWFFVDLSKKDTARKKKRNNNNKIEIGKLIQIGSKSYIPLDARNLASVLYQVNPTFLLFAC